MKDITLIFPHQLFESHPAVKKGRHVALIEDSLFFGDREYPLTFHKQKLLLHRASMKSFEAALKRKGHAVQYVEYDSSGDCTHVAEQMARKGYEEFHVADVSDTRLERRLVDSAKKLKVSLRWYESPLFLTTKGHIEEYFSRQKRFFMTSFYIDQRKRLNVLVEKGKPAGGKWTYDRENRKRFPRGQRPPPIPAVRNNKLLKEAGNHVNKRFPDHYGDTENFWFPADHRQSADWLDAFLDERLALFGDFEDAIVSGEMVLYHSVLTPMLNIGLLTPETVLGRTLARAETGDIPLNSLEGFVRQVIGWREFIRAMYVLNGDRERTSNFWNHRRKVPGAFYRASTGIEPVDTVVSRVLERAYCHHIERLMVLGNFMLLCRIHPGQVYRWFMELFIDSYDWVMVPNVYGMSQFADGGVFATKPYISGSNYILKMSDFKRGPWCPVWDSLFWSFIADNIEYFQKQPRLSIMARQVKGMGKSKLKEHRTRARQFLDGLKQ